MKTSKEKPPVFEAIQKKFGVKWNGEVVITYGDTIHCATHQFFTRDLEIHEETHSRQQTKMGVEKWWEQYLEDPEFRKKQEAEAYRNQSEYIKQTEKNREVRIKARMKLAKDFSSSIYGNIITFSEAAKIIGL